MRSTLCLSALAAVAALSASDAYAARSYDNCTGFIETLPATISTQGTWCLNKNLSTNMSSGAALTIATHNVTVDCNDFRIASLNTAASNRSSGIVASGRNNTTVRNCLVQNYHWGMSLSGLGALVEDNRVSGNNFIGIGVTGDGSVIRGNRVLDTGGTNYNWNPRAVGIYTDGEAEILGNLVNGVSATTGTGAMAFGINPINNPAGSVIDNNIKNVLGDGVGEAHGISFFGTTGRVAVDSNNLVGTGAPTAIGVYCPASNEVAIVGNLVNGFALPAYQCAHQDANAVYGYAL
jgi:hypothetical protein